MHAISFHPSLIFVEKSVLDLPLTQRILKRFSGIEPTIIDDYRFLKKTAEMTWAKKGLVLAKMRADPIKEFKAMSASRGVIHHARCDEGVMNVTPTGKYYSLDLISNCHLECTYCILQSFLENNPVITIFTNIEEILERLKLQMVQIPAGSIIGTGKIADSLALDDISEHTRYLVPFFSHQSLRLELKTKSDQIENLLDLDHGGQTTVSWSMNPPEIITREEYKTASFDVRIMAAKRVMEAGYPVGFHFDPMIIHDRWKENYAKAIGEIFSVMPAEKISWISVGTLRFPARQSKIIKKRFPKNETLQSQLVSTHRRFIHYPETLHDEMNGWMEEQLSRHLKPEQMYRCMDF